MNEREKHFVDSARRLFNESLADVDGVALSRLAHSRQKALARQSPDRRFFVRPLFLLGSGAFLAVTVLLLFLQVAGPFDKSRTETGMVADLSLIAAEESIDFFEDIEFYEWLSAMEMEERPGVIVPPVRPESFHDGAGMGPGTGGEGRGAGSRATGISWFLRG